MTVVPNNNNNISTAEIVEGPKTGTLTNRQREEEVDDLPREIEVVVLMSLLMTIARVCHRIESQGAADITITTITTNMLSVTDAWRVSTRTPLLPIEDTDTGKYSLQPERK